MSDFTALVLVLLLCLTTCTSDTDVGIEDEYIPEQLPVNATTEPTVVTTTVELIIAFTNSTGATSAVAATSALTAATVSTSKDDPENRTATEGSQTLMTISPGNAGPESSTGTAEATETPQPILYQQIPRTADLLKSGSTR
jgi:hypothetical protein